MHKQKRQGTKVQSAARSIDLIGTIMENEADIHIFQVFEG